jgi:hypothetical protein
MVTLPDGVPSRRRIEGQRFRQLRAAAIIGNLGDQTKYLRRKTGCFGAISLKNLGKLGALYVFATCSPTQSMKLFTSGR